MTLQMPLYKTFALHGSTADIAKTLHTDIKRLVDSHNGKDVTDAVDILMNFYARQDPQLMHKAWFAELGFVEPIAHINGRPYWPEIYHADNYADVPHVMFAPIGSDGRHFEPREGRLIKGHELHKCCEHIFIGGSVATQPVIAAESALVLKPRTAADVIRLAQFLSKGAKPI